MDALPREQASDRRAGIAKSACIVGATLFAIGAHLGVGWLLNRGWAGSSRWWIAALSTSATAPLPLAVILGVAAQFLEIRRLAIISIAGAVAAPLVSFAAFFWALGAASPNAELLSALARFAGAPIGAFIGWALSESPGPRQPAAR